MTRLKNFLRGPFREFKCLRAKRRRHISSIIVGKDHVTIDGQKILIRKIRSWAWHTYGIRLEFSKNGTTMIQDAVTKYPYYTFEKINASVAALCKLWIWLQRHHLSQHFDAFLEYGIKGLEDLQGDPADFNLGDLAELGLTRLESRRFLRARIIETQRSLYLQT